MNERLSTPSHLPQRRGPPPRIHPGPPQHQLDQLPGAREWDAMRGIVEAWNGADIAPSRRAAAGTIGLFLPEGAPRSPHEECFLIGAEFAHHHPGTDGGLHLVLPPDWHDQAIAKGWAVPHTWAGRPTVSPWTVLIFAPRGPEELRVATRLIEVAEAFARGPSPAVKEE